MRATATAGTSIALPIIRRACSNNRNGNTVQLSLRTHSVTLLRERTGRSMKEHESNRRVFSLKPRLLRCARLSQAPSLQDTGSDRSDIEWTIALATTFAQLMREPFFSSGNWEHAQDSSARQTGQKALCEPNQRATPTGTAGTSQDGKRNGSRAGFTSEGSRPCNSETERPFV